MSVRKRAGKKRIAARQQITAKTCFSTAKDLKLVDDAAKADKRTRSAFIALASVEKAEKVIALQAGLAKSA